MSDVVNPSVVSENKATANMNPLQKAIFTDYGVSVTAEDALEIKRIFVELVKILDVIDRRQEAEKIT